MSTVMPPSSKWMTVKNFSSVPCFCVSQPAISTQPCPATTVSHGPLQNSFLGTVWPFRGCPLAWHQWPLHSVTELQHRWISGRFHSQGNEESHVCAEHWRVPPPLCSYSGPAPADSFTRSAGKRSNHGWPTSCSPCRGRHCDLQWSDVPATTCQNMPQQRMTCQTQCRVRAAQLTVEQRPRVIPWHQHQPQLLIITSCALEHTRVPTIITRLQLPLFRQQTTMRLLRQRQQEQLQQTRYECMIHHGNHCLATDAQC